MYCYEIYGLQVMSQWKFTPVCEIELPGIKDITIENIKMPDWINEKKKQGYTQSSDGKTYFWFLFEGEGEFLIQDGNHISYQLFEKHMQDHVDAILLGDGFAHLFFQRGDIAIHAGGIAWDNRSVLISGVSGSGKSTISSELIRQGGIFMADDTVRLIMEKGKTYSCAGYPQQKLCEDAARKQGYYPSELRMLDEERVKYAIPMRNDKFHKDPIPVGVLVILQTGMVENLKTEQIEGSRKLEALISCLYNYKLYKKYGMSPEILRQCIQLAQEMKIIVVTRPKDRNTESEIVECIKKFMPDRGKKI